MNPCVKLILGFQVLTPVQPDPLNTAVGESKRDELDEIMIGAVETGKLKRPSKQRTRFSAILSCSDFRGSRFTSQVLPALGRKYSVQGPCAWPNSSFQIMTWAELRRQRALRSRWPSLPTQSLICSWDWDYQWLLSTIQAAERGRKHFMKALDETTASTHQIAVLCKKYLCLTCDSE